MDDYPDLNEDGSRRRRKRNYTDDAWGMAEYEDYSDGSAGDVEDYAGGLVSEEGQRPRSYDRPDAHNAGEDNQYTVATNAPENQWRSQHISGSSSEGVREAARLLQRMNARNSYPAPSYPNDQPRQVSARSASRASTPESAASVYTVGIIIMLLLLVMSCMILGFYVTFG